MRATSLAFVLAVLNYPGVLQPHEQDRLEAALTGRMERRLAEGDAASAAASADSLGHHYMNVGDYQRGAETLARALELDADYASRGDDFWRRLAGAHFLSGAYDDATAAYEKALDLDDSDRWTRACYADALMYARRYRDALEVFKELEIYEGPETDMALSAWVYVKARALRWIITETGYETQRPQMHEAAEVAGQMTGEMSPEERDDLIRRVWALDAACSLGWFNHARDLLASGKQSEAMHADLVVAVMLESDVEAWVNVAFLAIQTGDDSLLAASIITGGRLNANTYLAEFARQLRANQIPAEDREAILAAARNALMQVPSAAAALEAEAEGEHSAHSGSE